MFDQSDFSREAGEQRARLKSVNLYKGELEIFETCPLCESHLSTPIPKVDQVRSSLARVSDLLAGVHRDSPHIQSHISQLEAKIGSAADALRLVQGELRTAVEQDGNAKALQNLVVARGRFLGRLTEFLETAKGSVSGSFRLWIKYLTFVS